MTDKLVIYDQRGKITNISGCQEGLETLTAGENKWIRCEADIFTDYIENETVKQRPTASSSVSGTTVPADGVTPITLTGTPKDAKITIFGPIPTITETADGSDIELMFGVMGTYTVCVDAFPQLDFKATINAT